MSDVLLGGPTASDIFAIANSWVAQSHRNNDLNDRAKGLGTTGDEVASKLYNPRNEITCEYECHLEVGNLFIPVMGLVYNSYLITRAQITMTAEGFPRLSVTGHNHDDNAHHATTNPPVTYQSTITLAAQFGVPTMFGQSNANCGKRGLTYTLECEHIDEPDGNGSHLAGENGDGRETIVFEFSGVPSLDVVPSGWDQINNDGGDDNQDFDNETYNYYHRLARD